MISTLNIYKTSLISIMALSKFLDPKNDVAFRKVFGSEEHKDILIHFINDMLGLYGNDQVEDVTFLSPIQDPEIASKKQSIVDVLCKDKNGVQMIVEMQVAPTKGFEKRAQYYAAKAYSRQLNRGSDEDGKYSSLKEVIFIAISDSIIFKDKIEYKSDHVILDKKTYEHDLKDFSFTFIELPKFTKNNISDLENIVEKWCYFFKHAKETSEEDLKKLIGSDLVIEKAYDALNQFNWSEIELIAYEEELKRIRDNIAALDYQFEKGIEKGIEKTAINMLKQNLDLKLISSVTGLKPDRLLALKNRL
jgi:predicted transposase/invertase (TIGR01784 family)